MRTIMLRWPSVMAIIFLALNVDFVIMPTLAHFGVRGWHLFWCATSAATTEVLYWYWYSGWLARNIKNAGPPKRTAEQFVEEGLFGKLKKLFFRARDFGFAFRLWFVESALHQMEIDSPWKKGLMHGAYDIIKHTHKLMTYPMMIGLGFCPFGWSVAIVLSRVHYVPLAFPLYLIVNAFKAWVLGMAYLMMPLWSKLVLWAFLLLLLVRHIGKFLPRKNEEEHKSEDVETSDEKGSP